MSSQGLGSLAMILAYLETSIWMALKAPLLYMRVFWTDGRSGPVLASTSVTLSFIIHLANPTAFGVTKQLAGTVYLVSETTQVGLWLVTEYHLFLTFYVNAIIPSEGQSQSDVLQKANGNQDILKRIRSNKGTASKKGKEDASSEDFKDMQATHEKELRTKDYEIEALRRENEHLKTRLNGISPSVITAEPRNRLCVGVQTSPDNTLPGCTESNRKRTRCSIRYMQQCTCSSLLCNLDAFLPDGYSYILFHVADDHMLCRICL